MMLDLLRTQQGQTLVIFCLTRTIRVANDLEHRYVNRLHCLAQGRQLWLLVFAQRGAVKVE